MIIIKDLIRKIIGHAVRYYRRLPIKPLRGFLRKLYLGFIQPRMVDKGRTVIAVRDGIKYKLNLNQSSINSIYYEGIYEEWVTAIINKYVKVGMTVLDIGANVGQHTLRFAKLVGENGKVFAFEPMSQALSKLKNGVELNQFNNVIPEKMALSDINQGEQWVYFRSIAPIVKEFEIKEGKEKTNITTLDDYVRINNIKRINFIKIDVDGYEFKVIKGGINSIRKFKPIMVMEFGKITLGKYGDKLEDLIELLILLNYSFYSERNLKQYPNKKTLIDAVPPDATINVLCKPNN